MNPRAGFESETNNKIVKSEETKKVAVIGAGLAGINAAVTLSKKGHTVNLYEKNSSVGGMLIPGAKAKIKLWCDYVVLATGIRTANKKTLSI